MLKNCVYVCFGREGRRDGGKEGEKEKKSEERYYMLIVYCS